MQTATDILKYAHEAQVIGIDEGQFLGPGLVDVCQKLARMGKRVIVAGLDQDYLGQPFEPMPQLLAIAEYITKTLAICVVCGAPANRTTPCATEAAAANVHVSRGCRRAVRCRDIPIGLSADAIYP